MERIDDLQNNNLKIIQNDEWFCFGIDSVLLTEFAKDIKEQSTILDLGTGTGVIGLLLSAKVNPKKIFAIELQEEVADMAMRSVKLNKLEKVISVLNKDVLNLDLKLKFDIVISNPPYKEKRYRN